MRLNLRDNEDISFSEDEWLRDTYYHSARLVIKLNTNETVYSDDDRPTREEKSFWKRFMLFMKSKRLVKIDEIKIQFRSNIISPLPKKAKAYFFRKAISVDLNGGGSRSYFIVGYVDNNNVLKTQKFIVPALLLDKEDERNPSDYEDSLVWN